MRRRNLLYLLAPGEVQPDLNELKWPELDEIEVLDGDDTYLTNFGWGGPYETHQTVISIAADHEYALRYISECCRGVEAVVVRGEPSAAWSVKLTDDAMACGYQIAWSHDRHAVVSALGRKAFVDGLRSLQEAHAIIRGPAVRSSEQAMKTEAALDKALSNLSLVGYKTP